MKTINYRDGLVEFRIPATWKEEYSASDGGVFYADQPGSATLRLKVITAAAPSEITASSAVDLINTLRQVRGRAEQLPNGNAWAKFEESTIDRGQPIKTFYWFVSNPVPPKHARLATFSYTILAKHESTPAVRQEIDMIDREIRTAEFAKELGSFA